MGYHRVGFEVVGVDIEPQPHYPFEFIIGDAIHIMDSLLRGAPLFRKEGEYYLSDFAAFHASPPCQAYSMAGQQWRAAGKDYPDLIATTRDLLIPTGKPYVIENVLGSPLINPIKLNGAKFGMRIRRTRLFECSWPIPLLLLPSEGKSNFKMGRKPTDDGFVTPVGHFSGVAKAQREMGIDWMGQKDLAQAIPPAYTEYIGKELIKQVLSV